MISCPNIKANAQSNPSHSKFVAALFLFLFALVIHDEAGAASSGMFVSISAFLGDRLFGVLFRALPP